MGYLRKTVSLTGTEQEFITEFINQITSADSRITCSTDIAEQFADTNNTPVFKINFGDNFVLRMTRNAILSSSASGYSFTFSCGSATSAVQNANYSNGGYVYNYNMARTFSLFIATNEKVFLFGVGNYSASSASLSRTIMIFDGSNLILSEAPINAGGELVDRLFHKVNESALSEVKFRNNFTFEIDTNTVKTIDRKLFMSSNYAVNYSGETTALLDCTYVPANQIITMNNKKYYSLDSYTLMELSEN